MINCGSEDPIPEKPKAAFDFTSDNDFIAPSLVTFINQTTGAKEYTWDFGDGSSNSNNINPTHQYSSPGKYTVILIASNESKVDQVSMEIEIFALPAASFSFISNNNFQEPTVITFNNSSLYATDYVWDFGDGESSTLKNPVHEYTNIGNFTVTLTAISSLGEDVHIEEITVINNEELQLQKLKASVWNLTSVTLDNSPRSDFTNLKLTFSGTYGDDLYNYNFTGVRPNPSPWPVSGTWEFSSDIYTQMIRKIDNVGMLYDLTENNLIITFNYAGTGFVGGRIEEVEGEWKFIFSK